MNPRRMPGPGGRRYPAKRPVAAPRGRRKRNAGVIIAAVAVMGIAAALVVQAVMPGTDGYDTQRQEQVSRFAKGVLALEAERDAVWETYQTANVNISARWVDDVYVDMAALGPRQSALTARMRALEPPDATVFRCHALFIDAYEAEGEGYAALEEAFGEVVNLAIPVVLAERRGLPGQVIAPWRFGAGRLIPRAGLHGAGATAGRGGVGYGGRAVKAVYGFRR